MREKKRRPPPSAQARGVSVKGWGFKWEDDCITPLAFPTKQEARWCKFKDVDGEIPMIIPVRITEITSVSAQPRRRGGKG